MPTTVMTDADAVDALIGLYAYDTGCVDSGIHDEALRAQVKQFLLDEGERRVSPGVALAGNSYFLGRVIRDEFLSEEAMAAGYGVEDVAEFLRWLDDRMDLTF